jgi:hypothetical protein
VAVAVVHALTDLAVALALVLVELVAVVLVLHSPLELRVAMELLTPVAVAVLVRTTKSIQSQEAVALAWLLSDTQ